ncbi:TonB-dependent receptor [Vulcaniibacterium thermophilum]|uniref:TonB-dependent receptor n=1 Tax=Vulcaniibacterium thermophilum TaxID=1169913 RepID=A0A919DDW0_9GAMM|nr:TonB-dependent receptor [Vulcaniibacterium thermophilum]GHE36110.1 TonB-dependent receptor [Vulcaniibacterium thermophilum]
MKHRINRSVRFGVLPAAIAFALAPTAAFAQDAGAEGSQPTELDRIEVTGSRIKRADIETSQPIFTLSRQEIQKQGVTSVADVLQRISSNGAALNTTFNNGGDGSAGISLRNLGEGRTLVLVNGRRWTTTLGGSVDLNTIPAAIIERVEVLKDGASTIYGSDAIAGVVNIITRSNFDGAEAGAYLGEFDKGDGFRQAYDFTIGTSTDRSNVVLGASYVKEEHVMAGDRSISAGGPPFYAGQSGTGVPGSFVDPVDEERYVLDANGNPVPYDSVVNGYNTAPDNYLLTPQERTSLFAQATYDITDKVSFRTEMLYNERISEQLLAAMPVTGFRLAANSYYNPTNPDGFYGGSVGGGARELIGVNRRYTESGGRSFNQNVKTWHFFGGLNGFFEVGERAFDWDVGYRYDRTDQNDLTYGLFNVANLRNAYGPSFRDADGVIRCGTPGNVIAGCVPLNPLGPDGSITPEALAYASFTAHDSSSVTSKGYTANISGDIVELPGGMLSFAAGYEYRSESGQFEPDAFIAAGLSTGNGSLPTAGSYSLDEFYVELAVPVLADVPFAKLLDFSIASRYSDYSNFGDTLNSKFGFRWKPFDELLVRGNWSEGFRAPTINNLYAGDADSYESYLDPCSSDSPLRANPQVAARCTAEGVPADFVQPGDGSSRQTLEPFTWTSNEALQPETSTTRTLGMVYSPGWLEGFDISLDWWKVEIENSISRPQAQFILDKCYAGSAGEQAIYCALFSRDPNYPGDPYIITEMDMPLLNLASYEVEGWDMTVNYRLPETAFGRFAITWDTSYTSNWSTKATVDSEAEQRQGLYLPSDPYWRIKSNLFLDWTMGDFGATWGVRYRSGIDEDCPFTGEDAQQYCSDPDRRIATGPAPRNHMGAVAYHDVQFRYNTPWNGTVSVGANNVFDKDPPLSLTANYNQFDPQYDVPGRFMYVQYRQRF